MQDQWIRDGSGFLLVYSITSRSSIEECAKLYEKICRTKQSNAVPIVLVGNKCDLNQERVIEYSEGSELALKWNCAFFETSAKIKLNNEACFFELVRAIRRKENREPQRAVARKRTGFKCTIL